MNSSETTIAETPELLAPAGDWDCIRAAVENGANAVYLGLDSGFNARARATNFSLDNIAELMDFLHRRCVKGYVTLNTLAFTDELPRMESVLRELATADVDAVLVQDLGVARLLREVCPDLGLHASTQMTLTSAECIEAIKDLGIERVVLPRELSIDEIRDIRSKTDMPLEAFVHGALCVAYSGQCLTSESLGGRSANRGQCAQACRLSYDLICDGKDVELGDKKYLLSPQDLAAFDLTEELIDAGICSFKIEGRLKTPEYVANTVQHYRKAIDAVMSGCKATFSKQQIDDVEMSFSRGFSPGWLEGCDHKMLVPATSSTKRGVLLGQIVDVFHDHVAIQLNGNLAAGDGVVFEGDREHNREQGGRVYEIFRDGVIQQGIVTSGVVELAFDRQAVDTTELHSGLKIWKTDDPRLNKRLRASFSGPDLVRRVDVDLQITAAVNERLKLTAICDNGAHAQVESPAPLEEARKHPLTSEVLTEQLSRLGGTTFKLRSLQADIQGQPMVPLSVLGKLRHELIEQLNASPITLGRRIAAQPMLPELRRSINESRRDSESSVQSLNILCRTLEQLKAVIEHISLDSSLSNGTIVYADFADIREYREAVVTGKQNNVLVYPATPRIQKPGENGIFAAMFKHEPTGVLVRNLSGLEYFNSRGVKTIADFSLNVTNELTAEFLLQKGAERTTASYDMNRDQLVDLVDVIPSSWLEVVIHQHMPMFHMEHCVFCSVLSPGTNKTNCGRPCDFHQVELRDRIGMEHPLTADVGCRNTLFNATPQSAAGVAADLVAKGVQSFRIELLREDAHQAKRVVRLYEELLNGRVTAQHVWQELKATNRVGVTQGTLEERRNPLAIL